jgi:hypothetical protein
MKELLIIGGFLAILVAPAFAALNVFSAKGNRF